MAQDFERTITNNIDTSFVTIRAASDSDDASSEVSSAALRDEIAATRLDGVSGPVFFDGYNDRGDSTMTVVFADADEDTGWREVGTVRTTPARCVFPFSYNGIEYDECATVDRPMPWCATGTDSSGRYNGQWKACGADPEDEEDAELIAEAVDAEIHTPTSSGRRRGTPPPARCPPTTFAPRAQR